MKEVVKAELREEVEKEVTVEVKEEMDAYIRAETDEVDTAKVDSFTVLKDKSRNSGKLFNRSWVLSKWSLSYPFVFLLFSYMRFRYVKPNKLICRG